MIKKNFTKLAMLTAAFVASSYTTQAQDLWGYGTSYDAANGEFSLPFNNATGATLSDTDWNQVSVSHTDPVSSTLVTPGNSLWIRSTTGNSQGFYVGAGTPITSVSVANGSAVFDSDFLDNGNQANPANPSSANFGGGTAPASQNGELISPKIDLSSAGLTSGTGLAVTLHHKSRIFQKNMVGVAISADNGVTWTTAVDYETAIPNDSRGTIPFGSALNGITDFSQIRIKFIFDGNYYYSCIDDVTLSVVKDYDIQIATVDPNGTSLADGMTTARVSNHRYTPQNAAALSEFLFGAKLVNFGAQDVFPATVTGANPATSSTTQLVINVDHTGAQGTTNGVYQDTLTYVDTLLAYGGNYGYDYKFFGDINFINTYGEGDYDVTYTVINDKFTVSAAPTTQAFTITNNYLSNVPLNSALEPASNTGIIAGGSSLVRFEYGSMFYFPAKACTEARTIQNIQYGGSAASAYAGPASYTMFSYVYEWVDADADNALDADGLELTPVLIGLDTIPVVAGDRFSRTMTSFYEAVNATPANPAVDTLKDNTFYWITIDQDAANNGQTFIVDANGTMQGLYINCFDLYSYAINVAAGLNNAGTAAPVALASPLRVASGSATAAPSINNIGFGADLVPAIGITMNTCTPLGLTGTETIVEAANTSLTVAPNPVADVLTVNVEFAQLSEAQVIVTDLSGRVLLLDNVAQTTTETRTYDVANLPAGVYYLTVKTAEGPTTKTFVKQ